MPDDHREHLTDSAIVATGHIWEEGSKRFALALLFEKGKPHIRVVEVDKDNKFVAVVDEKNRVVTTRPHCYLALVTPEEPMTNSLRAN